MLLLPALWLGAKDDGLSWGTCPSNSGESRDKEIVTARVSCTNMNPGERTGCNHTPTACEDVDRLDHTQKEHKNKVLCR